MLFFHSIKNSINIFSGTVTVVEHIQGLPVSVRQRRNPHSLWIRTILLFEIFFYDASFS